MKTKNNITLFILGLMLMPSFLFGQGIIISSNAYVIANSSYVIVTGNMANSGSLNLQSGNFTMSGNYTNSGTYTQGTGDMLFNGSNQVLIDNGSGTMFTNVFFNGNGGLGNPAIMSSGNFSVSSTGVLNMANATSLNANGNLTLNSDNTGSATVAAIPSVASITGNVNVQRYITGGAGYRGYRLISSQVYAATVGSNNVCSINYLQNSAYLIGSAGGGFDKTGNPTLYLFREDQVPSNASFISGNFEGISAINNAPAYNYSVTGAGTAGSYNIPVGNGVMFFFRGNRASAVVGVETIPAYVPVTVTTTTTATLNQGQVIVHDWYTPASANLGYTGVGAGTNFAVRGFNLVGNPYASSIDWEQYNTTTTNTGIYANNVGPTIYELDPATNNYDTYQIGGAFTNHGTRTIVSGQGFFVIATNSTNPQLIFNETAKTATQNTGLNLFMATRADVASLNNANIDQHLRLQMAKDSINTDDTYIGFESTASTKYVFNEDAPYKPGNGQVSLGSFSSDNILLAINKMPLPGLKQETIPLFVTAKAYGTYKLNMTELEGIPQLYEVWLMDRFNKDSLDMRHNTTYAFDMTTDTNSYGSDRFQLVIRQNQALELHLLNFTATKATGGAQVIWKTENEQNYTNFTVERSSDGGVTFNVLGGFVSSAIGSYSFLDTDPPIAADKYRLKIEDLNGAISYSNIVTLIYGNGSNNNIASNISVYPNPASSVINLSINQNSSNQSPGLSALQKLSLTPGINPSAGSPSFGIKIISTTGSVIKSANSSQPTWQDNISSLVPGTYIIQVVNKSDNSVVGKSTFVKL
jgi:hypothetical protein